MIRPNKLVWLSVLCFGALAVWSAPEREGQTGVTDFAAYWTASRQLLTGKNPYAEGPVLAMERRLGFTGPQPLIMRNPPWALPFVLPFGLLSYSAAQRVWLLSGLFAVLVSTQLLWKHSRQNDQPYWAGWLATGLFLPVSVVLALGQMGPFILLGITGFLVCQEKHRDGWAGIFGLLIALKPHLVFLFWIALLFWAAREHRWRILWALAAALCVASAIAVAFDARVFVDYRGLWTETAILWEQTPTLGGALCLLLGGKQWVASLPGLAGLIWFAFQWAHDRRSWLWWNQMPILLLVSVASSPYAWLFDQVVLLPAVLRATAAGSAMPRSKWFRGALIYLVVNGLILALILSHRTTFWYAWTAPAWLLLYVWFKRGNSSVGSNAG